MKNILCFFGVHKWKVVGSTHIERVSKWEMYEVADGVCERCSLESEIKREFYY